MDPIKQELRNMIANFEFLTKEEVDTLVAHIKLKSFKKGSLLLEEGKVAKECYAVVKGCVREYHLKDGREKTTAFFTEGQAINSFSSYSKQIPSKNFLECTEDCILTIGNDSLVEQMCARLPRLQEFMQIEVEKDAGALQERMAFFMSSSPEERFEDLLENKPGLLNRVPQHQIASYLGITPESLSRIKKRSLQKEQKSKA